MSDIVNGVWLGILEGLTEFIPVSSTGHLILLDEVIAFQNKNAETFEIFIQLGAILAVVVLYFKRFTGLLNFTDNSASRFNGWLGIRKLFIACLPAFILGFLFHEIIKEYLFNSVTVAVALIVGGVIMIWIERKKLQPRVNQVEAISLTKCFYIGLFQCFALWPGMSRSGSTIIGGMLVGLNRTVAAEFSFLVAVPVMVVAVGYDMLKSFQSLYSDDLVLFAVGFIVSFVVALVAIKFFISILQRYTLVGFGYYRIILGIIVLIALR